MYKGITIGMSRTLIKRQQEPAKPIDNGTLNIPAVVPKPVEPCCGNCPCFHRGTNENTCHWQPPTRSVSFSNCRGWPPMNGTDCCWQHPVLQARYQMLVAKVIADNKV